MGTKTTRQKRASEMTDLDEQPRLMVFSADTHVGPRAEACDVEDVFSIATPTSS
jgi:hypothetical protein